MPRPVTPKPDPDVPGVAPKSPENPTTSWSVIQKMSADDPETVRLALDSLLQHYWYPIYVFIRAQHQCNHPDAEDITQALMIHLLAKPEILTRADPSQGTLRAYLLGCAKNFVLKDWEKRTAAKRDIRHTIAWDSMTAQERYEREPANYMAPDRLYARRWALTLLDSTFDKLRAHYREGTIPFDTLRPFLRLEGEASDAQLGDIARQHRTTAVNLRVRIHRLRKRWRTLILQEIKQTLHDPTDTAAQVELQELLACL